MKHRGLTILTRVSSPRRFTVTRHGPKHRNYSGDNDLKIYNRMDSLRPAHSPLTTEISVVTT